jgi:hypothetical protein
LGAFLRGVTHRFYPLGNQNGVRLVKGRAHFEGRLNASSLSRASRRRRELIAAGDPRPYIRAEGKTRRVATMRILLIVLAMLLGLASHETRRT